MKKIFVNIRDGMGNQFFCFAFGYAVAKKTGSRLILDTSRLDTNKILNRRYELENFNIEYDRRIRYKYVFNPKLRRFKIDKLFRMTKTGLGVKEYTEENAYLYEPEVFDVNRSTYFEGYWQNHKYFDECKNDLISMLTPKRQFSASANRIMDEMQSCCSVSIHVRRGDYVEVNWAIPMEYYVKALEAIRGLVAGKIKCYVFTDDKEYAKAFFDNVEVQDMDFIFPEYDSDNYGLDDFWLMSKCKHNIIANSSYSWWAAYINQNADKHVICPDYGVWTGDFYPEDWKRIKEITE